jgi:hypothetical protein
MALKITLDTNCFFDYYTRDPEKINKLIDFAKDDHIELAMTTRVMVDTHDKWQGLGASPIWQQIQSFPQLDTIGTSFRLDISRLDSGDYLISDNNVQTIDQIQKIMSDAQIEDIDHLFGHINAGRDIFITSDEHFLDKKEQLNNEFGAVILNPEDAIKEIQKHI